MTTTKTTDIAQHPALMGATHTHTTLGQRIAIKVAGRSFSIRENNYSNWYGYEGSKRVEMFTGGSMTQEQNAMEWLCAQWERFAPKPTIEGSMLVQLRERNATDSIRTMVPNHSASAAADALIERGLLGRGARLVSVSSSKDVTHITVSVPSELSLKPATVKRTNRTFIMTTVRITETAAAITEQVGGSARVTLKRQTHPVVRGDGRVVNVTVPENEPKMGAWMALVLKSMSVAELKAESENEANPASERAALRAELARRVRTCKRCGSTHPADRSCDCFDNNCQ